MNRLKNLSSFTPSRGPVRFSIKKVYAVIDNGILTGHINLTGLLLVVFFIFSLASCDIIKKSESDIEVVFTQDTLHVGYTYWWAESGPFIGNCGEELSLVFSGILNELKLPTDEAGPLYTAQKGSIAIEKLYKIKPLDEDGYANQKFVSLDCFYESGLSVGDTVLVICYDYENAYSIPGAKSILKIDSFEDNAVRSIRKYIDAEENPLKIKDDIGLWASYEHGRALERIIACREEMDDPEKSFDISE